MLHKYESFIDELEIKILKHEKLNDLKCYQFKESNISFPNIANSHISEALIIDYFCPPIYQKLKMLFTWRLILYVKDPMKIIKETHQKWKVVSASV